MENILVELDKSKSPYIKTFTDDNKEALINIMTQPKVVPNVQGGHLAIMLNPEKTSVIIDEFISSQQL